ncbi:hypothetical protein KSP39_PZI004291 [Platanthera zijinensis]|uniref:Uncharacterized protein n=1 Tax=Platanthera zijinensis TaxID=2320716 RepID=A0AAP0BWI9_9ASPA
MLFNNYCETFNKIILRARDKPIITMLKIIRVIIMKRLHTQRDKISKFNGEVCPTIQKILENNKKNAHGYILGWNEHDKFEVNRYAGDKWTVNPGSYNCSCRR